MPPLGWRKPPGHTGYKRKATTSAKKQSKQPRIDARVVEDEEDEVVPPTPPDAEEENEGHGEEAAGTDDAAMDDAGADNDEDEEEDERSFLPMCEISMSVSRLKHHVAPAWATLLHGWMKAQCEASCLTLEKGGRHEHLHCQVILRLRWDPNDLEGLKKEIKKVLAVRRGDGSGCRIELHIFRAGQEWETMLGYLHKDREKTHFQAFKHNIDEQAITRGIAEWTAAKVSFEDDKIVITKKSLFDKVFAYHANYIAPDKRPLLETVTMMLNSGKYVFSASLLTGVGGPMRESAAHVMWKLILGYKLTQEEVRMLLFFYEQKRVAPGSWVEGERYYENQPVLPPSWARMEDPPEPEDPDAEWEPEHMTADAGPLAESPAPPARPTAAPTDPTDGFTIDPAPSGPSVLRGEQPVRGEPPVKTNSTFSRRRLARLMAEHPPLSGKGSCNAEASGSRDSIPLSTDMDSPRSEDDEPYDSDFVTEDHESDSYD